MLRYLCTIFFLLLTSPVWSGVLQGHKSFAVNSPADLALSPDNTQLYVANLQGDAIEVLIRDTVKGDLASLETISGVPGLVYPWRVVASADGGFVYVITQGSLHPYAPTADAVLVFQRGGDGRLTLVETLQNGSGGVDAMLLPSDLALSAAGDQLYVRTSGSNCLLVFDRDGVTGRLTLRQTLLDSDAGVAGLSSIGWLAVSADGNFVYTTSTVDNSVTVFARDASSHQLALVKSYSNGSDGISGMSGAWGVALSPDQQHLYVSASSDGSVVVFNRDGASGMLTFNAVYRQGDVNLTGDVTRHFDGLSHPVAVSVSPDGQRVYVSGQEAGSPDPVSTLAVMRRDATDGSLSFIEVQRSNSATPIAGLGGVVNYVISADGEFLYSAGISDNNIGVFGHLLADLSLATVADADPVEPGATLNYSLTVTNNGSGVANGVAVSDVLSPEVTYVGTDTPSCVNQAAVLKCELGQLAVDAQAVVTVQVMAPLVEGQISNQAVVFSEYNDRNRADNRQQLDTAVANLIPNTVPVAVDDIAYTLPGQPITSFDVLANDTDADGDSLSIISVAKQSAATLGTLTLGGAAAVSYTPPAKQDGKEFDGVEKFVYRISDGHGGEDQGLLTVVVNTAPQAQADAVTVVQADSVQILVLANDVDADGNSLQLTSVDDSTLAGGSVQMNGDGSLTYTAGPDFSGNDVFTYTIEDSNAGTGTAQVTVNVLAGDGNSGVGEGGGDNPPLNTTSEKSGGGAIAPLLLLLLAFFLLSNIPRRCRVESIQ